MPFPCTSHMPSRDETLRREWVAEAEARKARGEGTETDRLFLEQEREQRA